MRSQRWRWFAVPTVGGYGKLNGWGKGLMVPCLWSLLCWSATAQELPCLESSPECLATLTTLAISQSSEIEAINQRLELTSDRIDDAQAREWTLYLPSSTASVLSADPVQWIDPLRLVQNLLGGGDVAANRLAIADLEINAADLLRRREEVAEAIAQQVIDLVLDYEAFSRRLEALERQLATQLQRQAVFEVRYRTGQGTTDQMLQMWQQTDELRARIDEVRIDQDQTLRELEVLCYVEETRTGTTADRGRGRGGDSILAEVGN